MQKSNLSLYSLLITVIITSCTNKYNDLNTITAQEDNLKFSYNSSPYKIDSVITKKGEAISFKFDENINNGILFNQKTNTQIPVYLENNKKNSIIIDSISNNQLFFHYNGENSEINNYNLKNSSFQEKIFQEKVASGMNGDFTSFKKLIKEAINIRKKELDSVNDEEFKKIENITIDYISKNLILIYGFRESMTKRNSFDSLNSEILEVINSKPIENEDFLKSSGYKNYLSMMSLINFLRDNQNSTNSVYEHMIYTEQYFKNPKIISALAENLVPIYFQYNQNNDKDAFVKDFINKYLKNSNSKEFYLEKIKTRNKLSKGTIAPSFSGIDINGTEISINDLKGKFLVIDVWATWCGPCKKESPHFKKLAEQYKDNDKIEFISISIDKNKKDWEDSIERDQPEYLSLWAKNDFESELAVNYQINAIPYFIIIDPNGKIAIDNVDRPSGKLENQIIKLLEQ